MHNDSRNCLTTSRACKLVWLYSNLCLAERTQSLEQGPQAQAWEVLGRDDEECQGSDADNSSSNEDSSSDEEQIRNRLLKTSLFLLISLR